MTRPAPRTSPLAELLAFLGSALAGLGVLRRQAPPLPEVPPANGQESPQTTAPESEAAGRRNE
ncbi:MAG: hypothetical protein ACKODL_01800 [Phenylobacterium sp.]